MSQIRLDVVPDSMAAGLLRAVSRLLDLSILPVEPVLRFLSQCCLSLMALLVTLQQEAPADTDHKRCVWNDDSKHCRVIKTSEGEGLKCLGSQGGNLEFLRDISEQRSSSASGCSAVDAYQRS